MKKLLLCLVLAGCARGPDTSDSARAFMKAVRQPMEFYMADNGGDYPEKLDQLLKPGPGGIAYLKELPALPEGLKYDYAVDNKPELGRYTLSCEGVQLTSDVRIEPPETATPEVK